MQQHALGQLRALTTQPRFRVVIDEEGFPYIPGRYGRIEWFDGRDLAVSSDRPRVFVKLWAIPGVRRYQTGDTEMRALFPLEALEQVAGVIKVRRRRALSPEEARRRGFKPTPRATSEPSPGSGWRTRKRGLPRPPTTTARGSSRVSSSHFSTTRPPAPRRLGSCRRSNSRTSSAS